MLSSNTESMYGFENHVFIITSVLVM